MWWSLDPVVLVKYVVWTRVCDCVNSHFQSCLTVRLTAGTYDDSYNPTIEEQYEKELTIGAEKIKLNILDTAGQEVGLAFMTRWICDSQEATTTHRNMLCYRIIIGDLEMDS